MKTVLPNRQMWIVFVVATLTVVAAKAQTVNGLTGNKTGNILQPGAMAGIDTGNSGISTPISAHATSGIFRFYYGDNILNQNTGTPVTITASRIVDAGGNLTAGGDAYIQFRNAGNTSVDPGTTSYIKLGNAPTITGLSASISDLLGLSSVYSILGYGYTSASNYVLGTSYNENGGSLAGTVGGTRTELLVDKNGVWHAAITPDGSYNSIRLNVVFDPAVNLQNQSRDFSLTAYNAFYYSPPVGIDCGLPIFTTPGATEGATLNLFSNTSQLLSLDTAVSKPEKAIDNDDATYSLFTNGALGIATAVSQTILFHGTGNSSDVAVVRISLPSTALIPTVLSNLTFTAYNGSSAVGTSQPLSATLSAGMLSTLGDNTPFYVNVLPEAAFDRIKISLGNLGNITYNMLGEGVRIYEVKRVANAPVITGQPASDTICSGEPTTFSITATGSSLTYVWQAFQSNTWATVGTSNPLNITNTTAGMDGTEYRVLVTGGACPQSQATFVSEEAVLTVHPRPVSPLVQLAD